MSDRTDRSRLSVVQNPIVDDLRVKALEALHTYVAAACCYDLTRASVVFKSVRQTLDGELQARPAAGYHIGQRGDAV